MWTGKSDELRVSEAKKKSQERVCEIESIEAEFSKTSSSNLNPITK